jgi:CxxC motif-containing protein
MSDEDVETQKNITCVVCPNSCTITVKQMKTGELVLSGQTCKRGESYATDEFTDPKRMLATTVRIKNAYIPLLPVRTAVRVPKTKLNEILDILARITVDAPKTCGDVIVEDIAGTGVNVIATRTLDVDTCNKIACELAE